MDTSQTNFLKNHLSSLLTLGNTIFILTIRKFRHLHFSRIFGFALKVLFP